MDTIIASANEVMYLEHLDDAFKDLRDNEHRLEQWVSESCSPPVF